MLIALGDAITREVDYCAGGGDHHPVPPHCRLSDGPNRVRRQIRVTQGRDLRAPFATTTLEPINDDDLRSALRAARRHRWETPSEDGSIVRREVGAGCRGDHRRCLSGEPSCFSSRDSVRGTRGWGDVITRNEVLAVGVRRSRKLFLTSNGSLSASPRGTGVHQRDGRVASVGAQPRTDCGEGRFAKPTDAGTPSQRLDRSAGSSGAERFTPSGTAQLKRFSLATGPPWSSSRRLDVPRCGLLARAGR